MPRHLRLHFRYAVGWGRLTAFFDKLRSIFDHYNDLYSLGLTFATDSSEGTQGLSGSVDVGACTDGPTPQAVALFEALAPSNMDEDEVAVLFPTVLDGSARWGCAQCPVGRRGVLVAADAPLLALPHEIAHLFLGTGHHPSAANLMYRDPGTLASDPPALVPFQVATLVAGQWALPSGAVPSMAIGPVEAPVRRMGRVARPSPGPPASDRSVRPARKRRAPRRKPRVRAPRKKDKTSVDSEPKATNRGNAMRSTGPSRERALKRRKGKAPKRKPRVRASRKKAKTSTRSEPRAAASARRSTGPSRKRALKRRGGS
jgi:hypothetical protein